MTGLAATFRGLARLTAYGAVTLPLMAVQAIGLALGLGYAEHLPCRYHRLVCRIFGFRIEVTGERSTARPTLFVCNHSSYLDIELLGSLIPGSFVAKSEVRRWPLFGWLARLQRTVFVDRKARSSAASQRDTLVGRLEAGDSLMLFPEGTSNDGNRVLPFKTALFSAAEVALGDRRVTVQPVSLSYARLNGLPIGREWRPFFAWYGDMNLAEHLWSMLQLGRTTVVVQFHRPVTLAEFGSRKRLADHCYRVISEGVAAGNSGRPAPPADALVPQAAPPAGPPPAGPLSLAPAFGARPGAEPPLRGAVAAS